MQEQDIPSKPEWSVIPDHARHVMLCTGPRCTQRGALRLWKTVRNELLAAGRMETVGGVLLTRNVAAAVLAVLLLPAASAPGRR